MSFLNLHEVELLARERLPGPAWDYFAGGAGDERTLHANRAGFEALALRPRMLVDVGDRRMATTLLGSPMAAPILVAPMAFQGLAHPDGELAMARAAAAAGLPMVVSTFATHSLEAVRAAAPGPRWFQLYVHRDRELTLELVRRAHRAGYDALVLTVDVPEIGRRERDLRNRFRLAGTLRVANFAPAASDALLAETHGSGLADFISGVRVPTLSWQDLAWLRAAAPLPLVLKGILRADDARKALDHGADGIVVSNHGGRQLDSAIATIRALPDIAAAVGDRLLVLLDGGVRRGTDVLKALALGARAVLLGRPALWGLAAGGEAGATRVLELLKAELDLAMGLAGAPTLADVTADLVA